MERTDESQTDKHGLYEKGGKGGKKERQSADSLYCRISTWVLAWVADEEF